MPLQAPGKPTQKQVIRGWTGVNLRVDPTDLSQEQLVRGVNIDLYERPGTILSRRGLESYYSGLTPPIRKIFMMVSTNDIIHADTTKLYRNTTQIFSNLDGNHPVDLIEYKGLNENVPSLYIANGLDVNGNAQMHRYDSFFASVVDWGITPPALAPPISAGTGALSGDYSAVYTYARYVSGVLVHESNPSPSPSAAVTLSTEGLDIDVTASTNMNVTHINIYRTVAGGSTFLFDQTVSNTTATVTSTQVDGGLGSAVDEDNDRPPGATIVHALRDRLWVNNLSVPGRLNYSPRFEPESFPANNFIDLGTRFEEVTAITSINNTLIVFTPSTKYRIVEQDAEVVAVGGNIPFIGASSADFVAFEFPSSRGCAANDAVVSTGFGIIYPSKDGIFVLSDESGSEQLISGKIQTIFLGVEANEVPPIDWTFEANMVAAFHRGRYYLSYTSTDSSDGKNDYTVIIDLASGESWFWDYGFTSLFFNDSFYGRNIPNLFLAGDNDENIIQLENANSMSDFGSDITSTVETASIAPVDTMVAALFLYMRIDAKVDSQDTLTVDFYTDSTLRLTATITGNHTRKLIRLPSKSRGKTWKMVFSYQGSKGLEIHGVEVQYKTLAGS